MDPRAVVKGSIRAVAESAGESIALAFLSADIVCIVDVSGSMSMCDSRGGKARYDVACSELAQLQVDNPGKIAVIAFSNDTRFCPGGVPVYIGGGTDLASALRFAQVADGTVRFIVISDGEPNDEDEALRVARQFTSKLDTVFVGPESERRGAEFLKKLAAACGGQHVTAKYADKLADRVQTLMLGSA